MALTCKTSLFGLNIGDYVWCKYTASSGAMGVFSDIATKLDSDMGGSVVPKLTSANSDGCVVTQSSQYPSYDAWKLFNKSAVAYDGWQTANSAGDIPAWVAINLGSSKPINKYSLAIGVIGSYDMKTWKLQGSSNGSTWVDLDSRTKPSNDWVSSVPQIFSLSQTYTYQYYRIYISSTFGSSYLLIDEMDLFLETQSQEIPVASSSTPSGYFKFICVGEDYLGRKKLIADRNIQNNISWDTLNSAGVCSGSGVPGVTSTSDLDGSLKTSIRLLTGGLPTLPTDNEWDKLIVSSTLGGNITAGSYTIWNWLYMYGMVSTRATSTDCNNRGYATVRDHTTGGTTATYNASRGFRPVLLIENLIVVPVASISFSRSSVTNESITVSGNISSLDGKTVKYRTLLNGVQHKAWTSLSASPLSVSDTVLPQELNIGDNVYSVEFMDSINTSGSTVTQALTRINTAPSSTLTVDRTDRHAQSVTISGTLTDAQNDTIKYRILLNGVEHLPYTALSSSPVNVSHILTSQELGTQDNTIRVEYQDQYGLSGFYEQIVTFTNTAPSTLLVLSRLNTFSTNIAITLTISDVESDKVGYKVLLNDVVIEDQYIANKTSGVPLLYTLDYNLMVVGSNTLKVMVIDEYGMTSEYTTTLIRKAIDTTYIYNSSPNTNFDSSGPTLLGGGATALMKPTFSRTTGYLKYYYLKLNIKSGNGEIYVAPLSSSFYTNIATYSNSPNIAVDRKRKFTIGALGVATLDITGLMDELYDSSNFGIAVYSETGAFEVELVGTTTEVIYQPTKLDRPLVVYGGKVNLIWRTPVMQKQDAFVKYILERDTSNAFSSPTVILETTDKTILHYMDTSVETFPIGDYYYRLKVILTDNPFVPNKLDFDLTDESGFTVQDTFKVDFISGMVKFINVPATTTTLDFATDAACTYDNTKVQFTGGKIQLKSTG